MRCGRGLKYVSLLEHSGYGVAARRYLLALARAGVDLSWVPMVPGNRWRLGYEPYLDTAIGDPRLGAFCNRKIDYDTVLVHTVPEYYPIWRSLEPGQALDWLHYLGNRPPPGPLAKPAECHGYAPRALQLEP
jgi:hypothetical protein